MNDTYYPIIVYSNSSEKYVRDRLCLSSSSSCSRPINRYNKDKKQLEQTNMNLFILNGEDHKRLRREGFFDRTKGKGKSGIECGEYHNDRKNRLPTEGFTQDLFLRFDKEKKFTHTKILNLLQTWLLELQEAGVIGTYNLVVPMQDREGEGVHKGIAFLYFNEQQDVKDKCLTFAMMHNRRISIEVPDSYMNVSWMKKRPPTPPPSSPTDSPLPTSVEQKED